MADDIDIDDLAAAHVRIAELEAEIAELRRPRVVYPVLPSGFTLPGEHERVRLIELVWSAAPCLAPPADDAEKREIASRSCWAAFLGVPACLAPRRSTRNLIVSFGAIGASAC
jgi:hypothetical protein